MLKRPDERTLKALHSLKFQEDWKTVREWIEESLRQVREEGDNISDETLLRWNQGGCQALARLLDYESKTKSILEQTQF